MHIFSRLNKNLPQKFIGIFELSCMYQIVLLLEIYQHRVKVKLIRVLLGITEETENVSQHSGLTSS